MNDVTALDELLTGADDPLSLTIPARVDRLPVVRSFLEAVLYLDDWRLDDVVDARIAVDEVSSQMMSAAERDSEVAIDVRVGPAGMVADISAHLAGSSTFDRSTFGWRIVETVTDTQEIDADSGRLRVRLGKIRG